MLEQYTEEQRVVLAHNYAFQSAFSGSRTNIPLAVTLPLTEVSSSNYGYNLTAKATEAEGV